MTPRHPMRRSFQAGLASLLVGFLWLAQPIQAEPGPGRNRLADAHSPYLLLHAGDPVDWYPWGEEAFARARRENKPIFLSIGGMSRSMLKS